MRDQSNLMTIKVLKKHYPLVVGDCLKVGLSERPMNILFEDQFWVKILEITNKVISTKLCEEEYINKYGEFLLLSENHVVFAKSINEQNLF